MSLINKHSCSNQQAKQFDFLPIVIVSRNMVSTFNYSTETNKTSTISLQLICQLTKVKDRKEQCSHQAILSILIANYDNQKIYYKKNSIFLYTAVSIVGSF